MLRLCGLISGAMLMAVLWVGCGSTGGDDQLVMQFLRFDNSGITQADSVREDSADVDIWPPAICDELGTVEPFTQTVINAVFRNNEASDITLDRIVIDVGATSGRAIVSHNIGGVLPGGRCDNIDKQCSQDADCISASSATAGSCAHTETTISGILLFDFDDKAHINPGTYSVMITFYGSDPNRSFETSTNYLVRFDYFDNCAATGGGAVVS
jgi:hypothetical protein